MRARRQRRLHRAGSLLLAALLFVPILVRGHHHAAHRAAPCATCIVAQHTPVVAAAVAALPAAVHLVVALESAVRTAPADATIARPPGRGPPPAVSALGT